MNERELLRARAGVHLTFLNRGSTRKKLDRPKARMPRARRRVGARSRSRAKSLGDFRTTQNSGAQAGASPGGRAYMTTGCV